MLSDLTIDSRVGSKIPPLPVLFLKSAFPAEYKASRVCLFMTTE